MPSEQTFDRFFITVNGTELPAEVLHQLVDAVVEDDLAQPGMFVLQFHDPELDLIDGKRFPLGGEVTIGAINPKNQRKPILVAEITALEAVLEQHTKRLVVRGYDQLHRLYRGRKTRTFLKQTDSGIAQKIAGEAGLSADVQATSGQFEYVMQDNQTDWEFLQARAARIGYRVRVDGKKLRFRQSEVAPPTAPMQDWGESLLAFRTRMTAVAQPNEVEVRGWDVKTKRALVGKASQAAKPSTVGDGKSGGDVAKTSFGSKATVMVTDQPVETQGEANNLAQAVLDQMSGDYLAAEGLCYGEPGLKAGTLVEVKGVGKQLSGKYFVTATRHEFNQHDGYRTTFSVNGHRPQSLLAAINGSNGHHNTNGVVIGIVTNNNDPDKLGRVKVKFPWLNEQEESNWARSATPGGGAQRGLLAVPEVNDEVLVAFEHGDISRPYVVGGLWNGKDAPPVPSVKNGKVEIRSFTTRVGHTIELHDPPNGGMIQIKTAGGHLIKISDTDKGIEIKSKSHSISLDDQGRAVKITSGGDVEIGGPGGKLKISASGVELTSVANMKMQANANLQVQANALLDVKTSAILSIQGSLVKIN